MEKNKIILLLALVVLAGAMYYFGFMAATKTELLPMFVLVVLAYFIGREHNNLTIKVKGEEKYIPSDSITGSDLFPSSDTIKPIMPFPMVVPVINNG